MYSCLGCHKAQSIPHTHLNDLLGEIPIPSETFIGKRLAQRKYQILFKIIPFIRVWIYYLA